LRPSHLPPPQQLAMHVDPEEFLTTTRRDDPSVAVVPTISETAVRKIGPVIHETYNALGLRSGWIQPGKAISLARLAKRDPTKAESNFAAARRMPKILSLVGLAIEAGDSSDELTREVRQHIELHLDILANAEHQEWMNWHESLGWKYAPNRDDDGKRHPCLKPYTELKEVDRCKDRDQVRHYPDFAIGAGFRIVFTPGCRAPARVPSLPT
jgi:hypothetical protein